MKILKKSERDMEIARYRKEQIDEGIVLAQKIDALRKTLSDLEKQYNDNVEKMVSEIENLTQTRDELRDEIKELLE